MLHDIGVAVDYDDHHKHSRYLILNGGLPGYSPREVALMFYARTRVTRIYNLRLARNKSAEDFSLLIIDILDVL